MAFVCSRLIGGFALMILLVGVLSCASNRPPPYVYTPPPPARDSYQDNARRAPQPSRTERTSSPRSEARAPRSAPAESAVIEVASAAATDETDSGRGGLFGFGRSSEPVASPAGGASVRNDEALMYLPAGGDGSTGYRLRQGDPVVVQLRGIPESDTHELVVDDQGRINLPYIPPIRAEGLTPSELQRLIQDIYIEERIYRQITVNVILPMQSYFVRGEVRQPGRFPLTSGMTVLKAIAAAGGYTEYANSRRINIIRAGETMVENARQMEQNPEEDIEVKAGDVIIVPRSIF